MSLCSFPRVGYRHVYEPVQFTSDNVEPPRTLYAKVELDSPVPPDLYAAVAQVIAFVYKLKRKTIA